MADQYSNRTDLQNPATSTARFTGQTYGQGVQQARSQQMVRPGVSPTTQDAQQMAGEQGAAPSRPMPGAMPFDRPTERPTEPLTAGANFGPGPNALDQKTRGRIIPRNDVLERLIALHNIAPNDQLRALIQQMMERR
jgi:hypothetical protein